MGIGYPHIRELSQYEEQYVGEPVLLFPIVGIAISTQLHLSNFFSANLLILDSPICQMGGLLRYLVYCAAESRDSCE